MRIMGYLAAAAVGGAVGLHFWRKRRIKTESRFTLEGAMTRDDILKMMGTCDGAAITPLKRGPDGSLGFQGSE